MADLSRSQLFLLNWLSKEDFSKFGECKGSDLTRLVDLDLARVGSPPPGRDHDYASVSLTEAGWGALRNTD